MVVAVDVAADLFAGLVEDLGLFAPDAALVEPSTGIVRDALKGGWPGWLVSSAFNAVSMTPAGQLRHQPARSGRVGLGAGSNWSARGRCERRELGPGSTSVWTDLGRSSFAPRAIVTRVSGMVEGPGLAGGQVGRASHAAGLGGPCRASETMEKWRFLYSFPDFGCPACGENRTTTGVSASRGVGSQGLFAEHLALCALDRR